MAFTQPSQFSAASATAADDAPEGDDASSTEVELLQVDKIYLQKSAADATERWRLAAQELARLKDDFNISVLTLTAGQGLLPHASTLNERLKEHVCVGVTPAASTRVSEDMGIPPGAMYLM